jgi:hypothetical protein
MVPVPPVAIVLTGAAVLAGALLAPGAALVAAGAAEVATGAADVEALVVAEVAGFGCADAAMGASNMAPTRRRGTQR